MRITASSHIFSFLFFCCHGSRDFASRKRIHGLCPIHRDYNCSIEQNDNLKTEIGYFGKEFCYCDRRSLIKRDFCADYLANCVYSSFHDCTISKCRHKQKISQVEYKHCQFTHCTSLVRLVERTAGFSSESRQGVKLNKLICEKLSCQGLPLKEFKMCSRAYCDSKFATKLDKMINCRFNGTWSNSEDIVCFEDDYLKFSREETKLAAGVYKFCLYMMKLHLPHCNKAARDSENVIEWFGKFESSVDIMFSGLGFCKLAAFEKMTECVNYMIENTVVTPNKKLK